MRRVACATLAVLAVLACPAVPSRADIAPDPQYGQSLAPFLTADGTPSTEIRMAAEEVRIEVGRERISVRAVFDLVNEGAATRLTIGFPDTAQASMWSSDPDTPPQGPARPKLQEFRATVDGEAVAPGPRWIRQIDHPVQGPKVAEGLRKMEEAAREIKDEQAAAQARRDLEEARSFARWWNSVGWMLWETAFEAGQRRRVEVEYQVPWVYANGGTLLGDRSVDYILRTGAPWKGSIGSARVELVFGEGVTARHVARLRPDGHRPTETGVVWEWKDLEPTEDLRIETRRYADEAEAADGYLKAAAEAAASGDARREASSLAAAHACLAPLGRHEEALAATERILAYEAATRAGTPGQPGYEANVSHRWRGPFEPWEIARVRALLALGRTEEARAAAVAALPRLERLLGDPPRGPLWMDPEGLRKTIEAYRAFGAGGAAPK